MIFWRRDNPLGFTATPRRIIAMTTDTIPAFSGDWRLRNPAIDRERYPAIFGPTEEDLVWEIERAGFAVEIYPIRSQTDDVPGYSACAYEVDRLGRHHLVYSAEGWTRTSALSAVIAMLNGPEAA